MTRMHGTAWEYVVVRWRFAPNGRMVVFQIDGEDAPAEPLVEALARYGAEGWELSGLAGADGTILFLKRSAPEPNLRPRDA
jgi:hypothetical protein